MGTNEQPGEIGGVDSPKTARQTGQQHSRSPVAQSGGWQPPSARHAASAQCRGRQLNVDLRPFDEVCNEHQYLLASLQRQDERIRGLLGTLCSVQTQQQMPQSAAEARKLRKDAGFVQSKIADAEQQERLINGRLVEVRSEMQRRNRLVHLRCLQQQQQMAHEQAQIDADALPVLWIPAYLPVQQATTLTPLPGNAISPLAPVFRPRNVVDTESSGLSADLAGLSVGSESTLDDGKADGEACQPAEEQDAQNPGRIRRGSWSMAADSSQARPKRRSLPAGRSVWPDDGV